MEISFKNKWIKSAAVAAGLTTMFATVSHTPADSFAVQETIYRFNSDIIKPRLTVQIPFVHFTHNYKANTQRIEFNAGSSRFWPLSNSTQDQNPLTARVVLNYKVLPDADKLAYHTWEMDGFIMPDGYWLLTGLLNDSANAVMGRGDLARLLSHPEKFLKDVKDDFAFRIKQNNIPIEIESLEMKEFSTSFWPVNSVSYGVVKGP